MESKKTILLCKELIPEIINDKYLKHNLLSRTSILIEGVLLVINE
jgi:hypothetical protein